MVAAPFCQPPLNHRCLVRAVVIQKHVDLKVDRHCGVDGVKDLAELNGAVAAIIFPLACRISSYLFCLTS